MKGNKDLAVNDLSCGIHKIERDFERRMKAKRQENIIQGTDDYWATGCKVKRVWKRMSVAP